jgi:hypothetical protein
MARPIIFTAESVRAILAGNKTQTRRVIKPQMLVNPPVLRLHPGDLIWVRESWQRCTGCNPGNGLLYRATCDHVPAHPWKAAMFMPRTASRITLEVLGARIERVQAIAKADALAEGISVLPLQSADDPSAWYQSSPGAHQARTAQASYAALWDSINEKRGFPWKDNPWVSVCEFRIARST